MAKKKERLTAIPRRTKARAPANGPAALAPATPDLSYIAKGLRGFAVPIGEVAFFVDNPRAHAESDLEDTKASLREFGQVELLVANVREKPPVILNGNGRLAGALALNWSHIAIHKMDLSRKRANALALALNRTGEQAGWNMENVKKALADIDVGKDERIERMMAELKDELKIGDNAKKEGHLQTGDKTTPQICCPSCGHTFRLPQEE